MDMAGPEIASAQVIQEANSGEFHPSYSAEDATLVIASRDGVLFRVHPIILRMAAEVFNNMLSQATDTGEPVVLHERSHTLKCLLDYIYPDAPYYKPEEEKFHSIWNLLIAADKYGINKVLNEFHGRLTTDSYFLEHPIQTYAIASRFGWVDVARKCALSAIDQLHVESHYLIYADSMSILKLYKFADKYRNALLDVVQDMLDIRYDELQNWIPFINEEAKDSYYKEIANMDAVKTYAAGFLQQNPSGEGLCQALGSETLKEFLYNDWENHYENSLRQCRYNKLFPENVDEIELDPDIKLID